MGQNRTTPEPPVKSGQNPGYSEKNPTDKGDAHQPADTQDTESPDDGGLDREPENMPQD